MSNHLVDLNCFPKKWYNHFWLVTFSFERKFRFTFETCLFLLEIPAVLLSVTQPMIKSQTMTEYLYQNRRDCQICTMIVEIFCFEKVQIFGFLKEDWVRNDGLALSADPEKQERKIFHASFWEAFCLRSDMWQDDYFCKDFASYFSVFALFSSIDYELWFWKDLVRKYVHTRICLIFQPVFWNWGKLLIECLKSTKKLVEWFRKALTWICCVNMKNKDDSLI